MMQQNTCRCLPRGSTTLGREDSRDRQAKAVRLTAVYRGPSEIRDAQKRSRAHERELTSLVHAAGRGSDGKAATFRNRRESTCTAAETWNFVGTSTSHRLYTLSRTFRVSRGRCYASDPAANDEISTSGRVDSGNRPGAESPANARARERATPIWAGTERATTRRATGHRTPEKF